MALVFSIHFKKLCFHFQSSGFQTGKPAEDPNAAAGREKEKVFTSQFPCESQHWTHSEITDHAIFSYGEEKVDGYATEEEREIGGEHSVYGEQLWTNISLSSSKSGLNEG